MRPYADIAGKEGLREAIDMRGLGAVILSAIGIVSIMAGVAFFIVAYCGNEGFNVLVALAAMIIAACVGLYAIVHSIRWSSSKR